MKLTRLLVTLVAALTCAALIAGCGGTSKAEYEKEVNSLAKSIEKDTKALQSGTPDAKAMESAQKSLDKAADELDDIDPPSEVEKYHDDLVDVLHDTSDLLGKMGPLMTKAIKDPTKIGADEQKEMQGYIEDFSKLEKRMKKIDAGFKKEKYKITGLEE